MLLHPYTYLCSAILLFLYALVQILISRGASLNAENANGYVPNACYVTFDLFQSLL